MSVVMDVTRYEGDQADQVARRPKQGEPLSRARGRHPVSTVALCVAAVLVPIGMAAALVALLG